MILSPNERLITVSLYNDPQCACDLAKDLGKGDTVIATNLRKMKKLKLITYKRTGIRKEYRLTKFGNSVYELLSTHDASFRDLIAEYKDVKRSQKCQS